MQRANPHSAVIGFANANHSFPRVTVPLAAKDSTEPLITPIKDLLQGIFTAIG